MRRRDFLRAFGVGAASVAVTAVAGPKLVTLATEVVDDPERLNWVPGKKRIFDLWPKHGYDTFHFSVLEDPNSWNSTDMKELLELQRFYNYQRSKLAEFMSMQVPSFLFDSGGKLVSIQYGGKTKAEIADDYMRYSVGRVANWFSPGYKPMSVRTGRLP